MTFRSGPIPVREGDRFSVPNYSILVVSFKSAGEIERIVSPYDAASKLPSQTTLPAMTREAVRAPCREH